MMEIVLGQEGSVWSPFFKGGQVMVVCGNVGSIKGAAIMDAARLSLLGLSDLAEVVQPELHPGGGLERKTLTDSR